MWLNEPRIIESAIDTYRASLLSASPNYVVIDGLFNDETLHEVVTSLSTTQNWKSQKHTYSALYVDEDQWQKTSIDKRFVQRDVWQRKVFSSKKNKLNIAHDFLSFLRSDEFMLLLSRIFDVSITDKNVADPNINTNYFRLAATDFVEQHADDSPGREICMLLYLNKNWHQNAGGELAFKGGNTKTIRITPIYNRCILFDPSSKGSEHWVEALNDEHASEYRYNVTSWYWSE